METAIKSRSSIIAHPAAINYLVHLTWDFGNRTFWKRFRLNDDEKQFVKECIREYYERIPPEEFMRNSKQYFTALCKEIVIAKARMYKSDRGAGYFPCNWLIEKLIFEKVINLHPENGGFTAA